MVKAKKGNELYQIFYWSLKRKILLNKPFYFMLWLFYNPQRPYAKQYYYKYLNIVTIYINIDEMVHFNKTLY